MTVVGFGWRYALSYTVSVLVAVGLFYGAWANAYPDSSFPEAPFSVYATLSAISWIVTLAFMRGQIENELKLKKIELDAENDKENRKKDAEDSTRRENIFSLRARAERGEQIFKKAKEGAYLDLSFDRALCSPSGVLSAKLQMRSFSPMALVYSRPEIHSLFVLGSRVEGTIEGPSVWHYSPEKDSILGFDLLIDHAQTGKQLVSIAVELAVDIDSGNGESKTRKLFGPFSLTAMQTNDEVIYPRKKEVPPDPKA